MKTRFFFSLAAAAVICFGGQSLNAQYPGQFAPGYGYQVPGGMMPMGQPGMMPGGMPGMMPGQQIVPAAFAQPSPFGAPAAFIPASPAMAPPSQVLPAGYGACDGKGCGGKGCDSCSKGGKGKGGCGHAWEFYGEYLFLRARDAEVAYAVPFNGPVVPPNNLSRIQVGPVGVLDQDYQSGFRIGFNKIIDDCTRIGAKYTKFESSTTDQVLRGSNAVYVVHSLVSHPSTSTAAQDFDQADGRYDINFDVVDVDMRKLFYNDCDLRIGWLLGVRAAQLQQQMLVDFSGNGTETVATDVDFTGVGVKFGLDAEASLFGQWLTYGSCSGSILPGTSSADFDQSQSFDPVVVDTGWKAGRVVTVWDLELGVSRVSRCGNYRFNAGYMISAWTNAVQTDEWIEAVHTNNFIGMDSAMTFDGLVGRFEARY